MKASSKIQYLKQLISRLVSLQSEILVIKYGGAIMKEDMITKSIVYEVAELFKMRIPIVLVHGGGPDINYWLHKSNINPKFKDGIRYTDYTTMRIVEMVLSGKVNNELVSLLSSHKVQAVGLSGKDANTLVASAIDDNPENHVGKIDVVNSHLIHLLLSAQYLPVVSPIATSITGKSYNINADTVAGTIASVLKATKLILLTDTNGILKDVSNSLSNLESISVVDLESMITNGIVSGGMLPKVQSCVLSLQDGVDCVYILNGYSKYSLLISLLSNQIVGSMILK